MNFAQRLLLSHRGLFCSAQVSSFLPIPLTHNPRTENFSLLPMHGYFMSADGWRTCVRPPDRPPLVPSSLIVGMTTKDDDGAKKMEDKARKIATTLWGVINRNARADSLPATWPGFSSPARTREVEAESIP